MQIGRAGDSRRQRGTRLFSTFALASLLVVLALGFVLVRGVQHDGHVAALAQGRAQAAVVAQMVVAPALGPRDLSRRLSSDESAKLHAAADLANRSGTLIAMSLRTFTGAVVFSSDGTRDMLSASDPAFRAASRGATGVNITGVPGRGPLIAIRVVQPVISDADGSATGVLELYLPYAPVAAAITQGRHRAYVVMAVSLGMLYLLLGSLSWSTTRQLRRNVAHQTHQALHDPLTKLPNRTAFRLFAEQAIADRVRGGALVLVDLNRFKEVNDTLGHHAGDDLLRCVATRLTDSLRTDDHVARLGGDEFGIVLPGTADHEGVLTLLDTVHAALGEDVEIAGTVLSIEASFGVALFPEHGVDLDQLLVDADTAMYHSKRGVRPTVLWEPGIAAPRLRSHEVHAELQRALESDQLVLHYQPKIDLATGGVAGVEGLARWNHPTRGLLGPLEFVPVAESSSLIGPFTRWVLRRALTDLAEWRSRGMAWHVSVNVSAHNLESADFVDVVVDLLHECKAEPSDLVLELTETALATDSDTLMRNITALAGIGVAVSVDDFGTGSTALLQLREVTVKEIKIDRAFVRELAANTHDQNVARAVVQMAHGMSCTVVAEGVEDEAAARFLRSIGCDQAQGFLFARPRPWQELLRGAHGVVDPSPAAAPAASRSLELMQ